MKFHYVAKLMNDEGTVLDDSRKWNQPMELLFGKKFKVYLDEYFSTNIFILVAAQLQIVLTCGSIT